MYHICKFFCRVNSKAEAHHLNIKEIYQHKKLFLQQWDSGSDKN